jgi:hypothetical protein
MARSCSYPTQYRCGDGVKPGWRATEHRRWIPGLTNFFIDGVEVTEYEYEIAAKETLMETGSCSSARILCYLSAKRLSANMYQNPANVYTRRNMRSCLTGRGKDLNLLH